jgi:hypothetical protein
VLTLLILRRVAHEGGPKVYLALAHNASSEIQNFNDFLMEIVAICGCSRSAGHVVNEKLEVSRSNEWGG